MRQTSPLATVVGSPLVRRVVNWEFEWSAHHQVARLARLDPVAVQRRTLRSLVHKARRTRFGRDHGFGAIRTVAEFQRAVPLRTYEDLWTQYLRDRYPVFDNLTWPGRIPYLALTSGTTQGATKYIPVSRAMLASNQRAAQAMVAFHMDSRARLAAVPRPALLPGRLERPGAPRPRRPPGGPQRDRGQGAPRVAPALHLPAAGAGAGAGLGPQARAARRVQPEGADHAGRRRAELAARPVSAPARDRAARRQSTRSGPRSRSSSTAASSSTPTATHSPRSWAARRSGSRRRTRARRASSPSATRRRGSSAWSSTTGSSTSSSRWRS